MKMNPMKYPEWMLVIIVSVFSLLAGCAMHQGDVEALKKVRFVDTPQGARAILDESILFKVGETTFANEANAVLDALKPAFDRARGQIIIEGHTDTKGSDSFNNKLSLTRAEKVRLSMIDRKFPPSRLVAKGYGKTRLARKPERSEADARFNRRAEFLFEGETVESIGGGEVQNNLNSMLDQLATQTIEAGKKIKDAVGNVFK